MGANSKERMPRLFLANQYPNIYSHRGLKLLRDQGFEIGGNLLGTTYPSDLQPFEPDLIIYSPTPEDDTTGIWESIKNGSFPFVLFSCFLDRDTGWNETEGCRRKQHPHFLRPLDSPLRVGPVFAASKYGADLVAQTYQLESHETDFNYIGIDFRGIREIVENLPATVERVGVLWDHMWRADKGFVQALDIIDDLSSRYPDVTFTINQLDSWRGSKSVIETLQATFEKFRNTTRNRSNIVYTRRFSSRDEYFRFLAQHDISFCLARIENFGAGMMEQSAVGIATSVPETGCYPEQYTQYVYPVNEVGHFVETLIQDPDLVAQVANQRLLVASSFDVANHLPFFAQFLHSLLNAPTSKRHTAPSSNKKNQS